MPSTITKKDFPGFNSASGEEWLETNGLGGWSSSTIGGALSRRYHGLLVAATLQPTERMNLVSKLDETIVVQEQRLELGTNLYANDTIHPNGYRFLKSFSKGLYPEWIYEAGNVELKKSVLMLYNENTVLIRYEVTRATAPFVLELRPFISGRGYHSLQKETGEVDEQVNFQSGIFRMKPYPACPNIYIAAPNATYCHDPKWYRQFIYSIERSRGLDHEEDLFVPGTICISLQQGDTFMVSVSITDPVGRNIEELFYQEIERRQRLFPDRFSGTTEQFLTLAADQFIVKRNEHLKTIIAGYHWFTDWSRDTMIALPGLALSTSRFADARKILLAFANSVSQGMLPNRFQDNNEAPEYNTVDGTLWYFVAIHRYVLATGDVGFVLSELLPVLKEIIDWHFRGTRFNIHVDTDGLLYAGEKGQQLTWMDARIGNWVVTPRMGKPVEVQALWYNALHVFAELLEKNGQANDAGIVRLSADKCRKSFINKFWYSNGGYLYDLIDENGQKDSTLRPNQLLAISLPFNLIDGEPAKSIMKIVEAKLYTPFGLRTLPPGDANYTGIYGGDVYHRDSAYHQGTAWSWLLGPYVDALARTEPNTDKIQSVINAFEKHLHEGCIGSVAEIFDADEPHLPRGCVAQAWGVAEWLRIVKDYGFNNKK
jgi:predicted glycogen debranching enzyme